MNWRDGVDGALEAAVVPSFSRVGSAVRGRLYGWRPIASYDLRGRVIAITGATSGIGLEAARELAECGAELVLVVRDVAKTERLFGAGTKRVVRADLGDLASVRAAAAEILAICPRLDVLIHNAGVLDSKYVETPDGNEVTAAAHVLGPFLLTNLLLARLRESAPSRVITMSSGGMYTQRLTVAGLQPVPAEFDGPTAYARAKRAQVTVNEMWAERVDGVAFHSLHPGWVDTPGLAASLPRFRWVMRPLLRDAVQGADTLCWLAADDGEPRASSGLFWHDRRPRTLHRLGRTRRSDSEARRQELWRWCCERTGVEPNSEAG